MLQQSADLLHESTALDSALRQSVIRCLLYFDIFNYPLKVDEVLNFLDRRSSLAEIQETLDSLARGGFVYQFNEFYSIQDNRDCVVRRIRGNEMAEKMMPLAKQKANFIGQFPFVRSVMVSGSLSKGYMDADSDIDFFVVTEPGRLWISRMLLVMYKRIFLRNSYKHFCVNYFISEKKLEIEEKNIFTATELATVVPQYNQNVYASLLKSNGWLTRFFPNLTPRPYSWKKEKPSSLKILLERIINLAGGSLIDGWCMKITYRRWRGMYQSQYDDKDFQVAFKTKKHASKNHPKNYQKKVTESLNQRWKDYCERLNGRMI